MSMIDDIKRDHEAGTKGPWEFGGSSCRVLAKFSNGSFWEIASAAPVCFASDKDGALITAGGDREANARRIARVPDIEAALLAADELAVAADKLARFAFSHMTGGRQDLIDDVAALTRAYRKTTEAKP